MENQSKCNHDCFNCTYDDCITDITEEAFKMRERRQADPGLARQKQQDYRLKIKIKNGIIDEETMLPRVQKKLLDFIIQFTTENLYPPSTVDMEEFMGLSNSSVNYQLHNLEKSRYLKIEKGARRITLIGYKLIKE